MAKKFVYETLISSRIFGTEGETFTRFINHKKIANVRYSNLNGISALP